MLPTDSNCGDVMSTTWASNWDPSQTCSSVDFNQTPGNQLVGVRTAQIWLSCTCTRRWAYCSIYCWSEKWCALFLQAASRELISGDFNAKSQLQEIHLQTRNKKWISPQSDHNTKVETETGFFKMSWPQYQAFYHWWMFIARAESWITNNNLHVCRLSRTLMLHYHLSKQKHLNHFTLTH